MKTAIFLSTLVLASSMTGCLNEGDKHPSQVTDNSIATQYQGIWHSHAYATAFEISHDTIRQFSYSSDYCIQNEQQKTSTSEIARLVRLLEGEQAFEMIAGYGTPDFAAPGAIYHKESELPNACQHNLITSSEEPDYVQDSTLDLAIFYQFFTDYYFGFGQRDIDFDSLYSDVVTLVTPTTPEQELAEYMVYLTNPLADTHIQIIDSDNVDYAQATNKPLLAHQLIAEFAEQHGLPFPIPEVFLDEQTLIALNHYIESGYETQWNLVSDYATSFTSIHSAANGLIRWFTNQGLGYLYIGAMTGFADETGDDINDAQAALNNLDIALDKALTELADVEGLIIDIRTNSGGNDYISLAIASRFTSQQNVHVYSKQARDGDNKTPLVTVSISPRGEQQYLGNIVLLTSANTVSAAEVFALAMRQLPNVTLVGENTQGAFSDILTFTLPNGMSIGLSNEYYLSPQGEWMEYIGVPVDFYVPFFTPEQRQMSIDAGIETAIQLLTD